LKCELRGVFVKPPDLRPKPVKLFVEAFSWGRKLSGLFSERLGLVAELLHPIFELSELGYQRVHLFSLRIGFLAQLVRLGIEPLSGFWKR